MSCTFRASCESKDFLPRASAANFSDARIEGGPGIYCSGILCGHTCGRELLQVSCCSGAVLAWQERTTPRTTASNARNRCSGKNGGLALEEVCKRPPDSAPRCHRRFAMQHAKRHPLPEASRDRSRCHKLGCHVKFWAMVLRSGNVVGI